MSLCRIRRVWWVSAHFDAGIRTDVRLCRVGVQLRGSAPHMSFSRNVSMKRLPFRRIKWTV